MGESDKICVNLPTRYMSADLTFITNEKDKNLSERFKVFIKDTKFSDVLVGFFTPVGFTSSIRLLRKPSNIK